MWQVIVKGFRVRIYLGDIGHNLVTVTVDTYPLGVANLATYASAYAKSPDPLEIEIFKEPQELRAAIDRAPPDVLGVSSYSWNHHLSASFATYAKQKNPKVLTLMGGPNFPLTAEEQDSWMRTLPQIDVQVRGPTYEGEQAHPAVYRCRQIGRGNFRRAGGRQSVDRP